MFKIHILKFLFNEDSLRRTYENLKYNILYRWFIGYNLCEDVPDHSTYSQNYKIKFSKLEKDILQTVFDKVIDLLLEYNCLDMTAVYIDSTNTKAYANKKKNHKETVKIESKKYQKELGLEIALKGLQDEDLTDDEYLEEVEKIVKCNEEMPTEKLIGEKEIIISDTDKDAGMLYKNKKEKVFYYCGTYIRTKKCNKHYIQEKELDEIVLEFINKYIELLGNVANKIDNMVSISNIEYNSEIKKIRIIEIEKELLKYENLINELVKDYKSDLISQEDFDDFKEKYLYEKNKLSIERENLNKKQINSYNLEWINRFKKIERLENIDRNIVDSFIENIYVGNNKEIEIDFKFKDQYKVALEYLKMQKSVI